MDQQFDPTERGTSTTLDSRIRFERPLTFSTKFCRKRQVALHKKGKINIKSKEL